MLVSFLWPGAGLFFVPDRIPMGIIFSLASILIHIVIILIGAVLWGVGIIFCSLPLLLLFRAGMMFWTYKEAERYNQGR